VQSIDTADRRGGATTRESSGCPIVVVEDDAGMRKAMAELLRAAGFEVAAFTSAEEFLASAMSPSAALILDVHLPGLSGFDLYEQVRPSTGEPPVIFITAHDTPSNRARSERLGAAAYLPKPFAGRKLLEALHRVIAKGQA
jgi:two-component system response regulator GlrR